MVPGSPRAHHRSGPQREAQRGLSEAVPPGPAGVNDERGSPSLPEELFFKLRKTAHGFGLRISDDGEVTAVNTEQAKEAGVMKGMRICEVNGQSVDTLDDIRSELSSVEEGETATFTIVPEAVSPISYGQ